jgi:segregation and condensation protein B
VGRPALYATTRQFLDDLGLAALDQLPLLEEPGADTSSIFEALAESPDSEGGAAMEQTAQDQEQPIADDAAVVQAENVEDAPSAPSQPEPNEYET